MIEQRFQVGDIVRFNEGAIDWEVAAVIQHHSNPLSQYDWHYILKSGMSGRRMTAFETHVRPWVPHE